MLYFALINHTMQHYLLSVLLLCALNVSGQMLPLIPMPAEVKMSSGIHYWTSSKTRIHSDPRFAKEVKDFTVRVAIENGFKFIEQTQKPDVLVVYDAEEGPAGAYLLTIDPQQVVLKSHDAAGVFYGLHTLQQLLPAGKFVNAKLPCLAVKDYPAFQWRGMHLDCSRHFFPVSFVKKYIDRMASYKMNTFHWHLTDDQGWRIEIKKYPKLTSVGAWRKGSMVGHYRDQKFDSIRYGGFYTQKEIKEVVQYAAERHVTIVPEIEMPGHSLAAIAAYPEYSCTGNPAEVGMQWGIEKNVFCPNEQTFQFLNDVLKEVAALFPGKYIHIGGDEVLKEVWDSSAFCRQLMKEKNMKDAHELQSWFIGRVEKMVNALGKQVIGWDEILEGGLAPNAAVMSWRGTEGGIAAAKQQHYVVMSPGSHCYFDHYQGHPDTEPLAIGGNTPLGKVYSYQPIPEGLTDKESKYILGAQANLWTEYINSPEQAEYMAFPRMLALAEVVWSNPVERNYEQFLERLRMHRPWLDLRKVNYSKTAFN